MWKCSYAAVPGHSHNRNNYESCQDVVLGLSNDTFACICLSDGAGSAKYAKEGASTIVESSINLFKSQFELLYESDAETCARTIINNCIDNIEKKFKSTDNFSIHDYSGTLLVVAILESKCICVHVGDGIIGVQKENSFEILSYPWNGEYKNETVFVTSKKSIKEIDIKKFVLTNETGFFIMSDGTQNSFYSSKNKKLISLLGLSQIFDFSLTNTEKDINAMLDYNLFNLISNNTSDDCSFGMIIKE